MTIQQIKRWFETAKPNPTKEDLSAQIGVHFSEVAEMLDAMDGPNWDAKDELLLLEHAYLKQKEPIHIKDREEMLDALCDQIVTAIGVAHMLGMDIAGALQEVARSNDSKFVNGLPIFNEYGKIMKGPNYTKPDLSGFVL